MRGRTEGTNPSTPSSTRHRTRCRRACPGDLIRTEPSRLVLEPSGQLGAIFATGTRIMYRSTDARGNPIAVTGTYFEPYNPGRARGLGR